MLARVRAIGASVLHNCGLTSHRSIPHVRYFMRSFRRCRVREVYLCVDNIPVVFARSILPTSSCTGINRDLLQVGNKPLGDVLFKNGQAPILLRQVTEIPRIGFGRRTLYQLRPLAFRS